MLKISAVATSPDVVCSPLQEGGVLFDLATKQYFALNSTGLLVWQYLEDGGTLDGLERALHSANGSGTNGDFGLARFVEALSEHGLTVEGAEANGEAAAPSLALPPSWEPPNVTPHGRPLSQVILSPFDPTVPIPE